MLYFCPCGESIVKVQTPEGVRKMAHNYYRRLAEGHLSPEVESTDEVARISNLTQMTESRVPHVTRGVPDARPVAPSSSRRTGQHMQTYSTQETYTGRVRSADAISAAPIPIKGS
ncbi:hypothetical protein NDU88_003824 [Pleurodeles waltl]|uniref:Uncharacterized protein n=1 Tax=Pleurodeles waltl TaxID=8319 RepID=A0AAV7RHB2_PLEWA|nr:hypothetical protein NDU88_003824 [Pleurodeles waltl]